MLSERGYFWWHGAAIPEGQYHPPDAVAGLLTISDAGRIRIELDGVMPNPRGVYAVMQQGPIASDRAIAGLLSSEHQYILATQIFRSGGRLRGAGISSEAFTAIYGLISSDPIDPARRVKSLHFDLSGYAEWMWLGSVETKRTDAAFTIIQKVTPERLFRSERGTARLFRRVNYAHRKDGATLQEQAGFTLWLRKSVTVPEAERLYSAVQDFLILLTNSEFQMSGLEVTLTSNKTAALYFGRTENKVSAPGAHECAVPFPAIEAKFGDVLFAWLNAREELGAAAYLYMATRRGFDLYAEHRFLNLITGLESYHRKRIGDGDKTEFQVKLDHVLGQIKSEDREWARKRLKNFGGPNLETRLTKLLEVVPVALEAKKLVKLLSECARVRNQIAHQGHSHEADATGEAINWISMRSGILGMLYHARLLLEISIPRDLIERWLETNSHLNWYLERAGFGEPKKPPDHPASA